MLVLERQNEDSKDQLIKLIDIAGSTEFMALKTQEKI